MANKVVIKEFKVTTENPYENRINVFVKYGNESIAVTATCGHWFTQEGKYIVKHINSFGYLTTMKRKSLTRDNAIKTAIRQIVY